MLLLFCALQLVTELPQTGQGVMSVISPSPFHSVGFELPAGFQGAEVAILGPEGAPGPWWPVIESADLSNHQLGGKHYSALVHGSSSASTGIILRQLGSSPVALSVLWISAATPTEVPVPSAATRPPVFDRGSWGANPPSCTPSYCNTTHIAMHHTASASEYASTSWQQCAANVKAIQVYHMVTRGWCDIGYNYLICHHGDIFEGRGGGDNVRGAHDGYNCGSMGVSMMGYFHPPYSQTPPTAMKDSFVALSAWKCEQQNIDPLASSWYMGLGAVEENIFGHRDVSSTACPGDLAYAELPLLRVRIDAAINSSGTEIILDNGAASFSGSWNTGTSAPGHFGADYRWASTGTAPARALWKPTITDPGIYQVSLWWPAGSNRNPATTIGASLSSGLYTGTINQQSNGGQWNILGNVFLPAGSATTFGISNAGASGWVVVADALRLVKQ